MARKPKQKKIVETLNRRMPVGDEQTDAIVTGDSDLLVLHPFLGHRDSNTGKLSRTATNRESVRFDALAIAVRAGIHSEILLRGRSFTGKMPALPVLSSPCEARDPAVEQEDGQGEDDAAEPDRGGAEVVTDESNRRFLPGVERLRMGDTAGAVSPDYLLP